MGDAVCPGPGGNGAPRFSGALDEVRLYGRSLSGAEITSLAQNAPTASCAGGLLTYWRFNEGGGATASDACHSVTNVYDADDRLVQTTNGRGDVVTYAYDGPNGYGSTDVNGYTQIGLLSSKTDGNGHKTSYTYTARNEPLATYYADGTTESIGTSATSGYDADDRLTDITYPALHATHFGYDAGGRRTLMTDATGTTTWAYGDGLHLTQQQSPQGTVTYSYYPDGRRQTMGATGAGAGWTYKYDNGGRLTSLTSPSEGTASFGYDEADRLIRKTKGDGDFETDNYDAANQLTTIGYWWLGGTLRNVRAYAYDLAGSVIKDDQGYYALSYLYDGAGQLTGEVGSGSSPPSSLGYSYDHNGNRLAQTVGGSLAQSFTYDAHDKLTGGTAGNETDGYDLNGNETVVTINGATYRDAYDEEDRLTSVAIPGGPTDAYAYNGLGLRVGKQDSTGTYSYLCDGASPGAPVLSDGHALYTPGLSENRGGAVSYPAFDRLGNLWTQDASGASQLYYQDTSGFGTPTFSGGGAASPFKFGGGNGCQTDADTGLVLMGHRYFDARTGRFLTQDPAGDGDNWYAYCGNDPVDGVDPSGLEQVIDTGTTRIIGTSYPDLGGWGNDESIWSSGGGLAALHNALYGNLDVITYHGYTPAEVHKIKHLINIINATPVGHGLIKKAVLSSKDYKIIKNRGMPVGYGRTGETYFNLDWHTRINTVDGGRDASSLRILAHEFGHSIGGYSDNYDPANPDPYNVMMNVDHVENPIMTSLDGPGAARTTYNTHP